MERLLNPQMERDFTLNEKAFNATPYASRSFQTAGSYSGVREVSRPQEFGTRSFLGIRNPWFGKKVYQTQAARDLTRYVLSDRAYATQTVEPTAAPEARRAVPTSRGEIYARDYVVQGRSQAAISAQHSGGAPLSLDEVRELLNRNR